MRTRKIWNQIISLILVLALLPVSALAQYGTDSTKDTRVINEPKFKTEWVYVDPQMEQLGLKIERLPERDFSALGSKTVNSFAEAGEYLREQFENREEAISLTINNYLCNSYEQFIDDLAKLDEMILTHTGVPTQGDYIKRHLSTYYGPASVDGTKLILEWTVIYHTNTAQEKVVDARVDELIAQWDSQYDIHNISDEEKITVIYDYICENVVYDYDHLAMGSSYPLMFSAYAALVDGQAVCQGYSNLFYRLALELGVDTRIISGFGNGGPHSWNIAELGNSYYYLDSTWDAPRAEVGYPYEYFLLGSENFLADHILDAEYEAEAFQKEYPISKADYDFDADSADDAELIAQAEAAGLLKYLTVSDLSVNLTRLEAAKLLVAMMELEPVSGATLSFADCDALTQEEKELVAAAVDAGLINGVGPDAFAPYAQLTKAELATLIYRALGEPETENSGASFPVWYLQAVIALQDLGIITEEDITATAMNLVNLEGTLRWLIKAKEIYDFNADSTDDAELIAQAEAAGLLKYLTVSDLSANLTRLDAVKLLVAMMELEPVSGATLPFADCDALTQEEKELVAALVEAGIISGTGPDTFEPYAQLTYGQLAIMVCRALGEPVENGSVGVVQALVALKRLEIITLDGLSTNDNVQARDALDWMIKAKEIYDDNNGGEEGIIASGECGDNLVWTLNSDGTLTISGTGEMDDLNARNQPWYDYRQQITAVVVEDGVTSIGSDAFFSFWNMASVTLPDSLTSIGSEAFAYCESLREIVIPASVTDIGDRAFVCCAALPAITVAAGNAYYCAVDGVLFNKDKTELILYPSGKEGAVYKIPNGVTRLGVCSFEVRDGDLVEVVISASVVDLNGAFERAETLTTITVDSENEFYCSVDGVLFSKDMSALCAYPIGNTRTEYRIPNGVETILDYAFQQCPNLRRVIIPDGVTMIGAYAFGWCYNLMKIVLPASLMDIGWGAFDECQMLSEALYVGTEEQWGEIWISERNDYLLNAVVYEADEDDIYELENVAEGTCGANLTWVLTDDGTLTISGTGAMDDYNFGEAPWYAQIYSPQIVAVVIEDGVTSIGDGAFALLRNLVSVTIPASVMSIGDTAFLACDALATVYYGGTEAQWKAITIGHSNGPLLSVIQGKDDGNADDAELIAQAEAAGLLKYLVVSDLSANLTRLEAVKLLVAMMELEPVSGATLPFADCDALTQEEKELVAAIVDAGIVKGYDPDTFGPYDQLTYGQLAAMLCRALGESDEMFVGPEWLVNATRILLERGILKTEDNLSLGEPAQARGALTLMIRTKAVMNELADAELIAQAQAAGLLKYLVVSDLSANLTRLEAVKLLVAMLELKPVSGATLPFVDCDALTQEERELVAAAVDAGLINGVGPDAFDPYAKLTKAALATLIYRALDEPETENSGGSFPVWYLQAIIALQDLGIITEEDITATAMNLVNLEGTLRWLIKAKEILDSDNGGEGEEPEIPEGVLASGKCGENLVWTLTSDGTLTISGTGEMFDFESVYGLDPQSVVPMSETALEAAPWSAYTSQITKVVVKDGVTSIGDNAFAACENLKEIEIPETVTEIGDDVFSGCEALETVTYTGSEEQWNEIEIGEGNEAAEEKVVIRSVVMGDVTGDGVVDVGDAVMLLKAIASKTTDEFSSDVFTAADVTRDGTIDVGDAVKLLKAIASKTTDEL